MASDLPKGGLEIKSVSQHIYKAGPSFLCCVQNLEMLRNKHMTMEMAVVPVVVFLHFMTCKGSLPCSIFITYKGSPYIIPMPPKLLKKQAKIVILINCSATCTDLVKSGQQRVPLLFYSAGSLLHLWQMLPFCNSSRQTGTLWTF